MHFQILPTTRCNARCFYCYELNQTYENMNDETVKNTISFINSMAQDSNEDIYIDWFGGEPLLSINTIETIAANVINANSKKQVIQTLVTNGSLLNQSICNNLLEIKVQNIQITLDGNEECYCKRKNYYDKNISFNTVIKNIDLCIASGFNVSVRINVDKENFHDCKSLITFLNQHFSNTAKVYVAPLYGIGDHFLDENNVYEILKELRLHIFSSFYPRNNCWGSCLKKQDNNIFIKPDGTIVRCEHMFANNKAIIGDVFNGITKTEEDICINCQYLKICKQGCITSNNCNNCWRNLY